MRTLLSLLCMLALAAPAAADADTAIDSIGSSPTDDDRMAVKPNKKKKKKKKKKRGAAEETPPPPPPDTDKDGIIDETDGCLEEAEDVDGFEDGDGCPDPDNDGDEVLDADDACPDEAENKDGWDDEDGCPEAAPAIAPMTIDATLMDGTTVKGTLIRIVATDEDSENPEPTEPTELEVIVGDVDELSASWSNVRSLSAKKVKFSDSVDCYSEGVQELGEAMTWECTLKNRTTVKLSESDKKGSHLSNDRKMHRYDLKIDGIECSGDSCETVQSDRGLSIYLYKVLAFVQNDDEYAAVKSLQERLREMQKVQILKATFKPVE